MKKILMAFLAITLILPLSANANVETNVDTDPTHYHSQWDSQSEYPVLEPLEIATVWINFQNTGTATWHNNGEHPVRLGTSNPNDRTSVFYKSTWLSENRAATLTESEVAPGDIGTFKFYIKAPEKPGNYQEYFRPVVEGLTWMEDDGVFFNITVSGDPNSYTEPSSTDETSTASYQCAWDSQSDYLSLTPGETGSVWVKFKNTGTAVWHNYGDNQLHLGTDRAQDRSSDFIQDNWLSPNRAANLKESTVQPGEYGTFEFTIKAPSTTGTYIEYYRPVAEGLTWLNDNGVFWKFTVTSNNSSNNFQLTAQVENGQVILNWNNYTTLQTSSTNSSISGYKVVRSETNSNPTYPDDWWVYLDNSSTTTYTDTSVQTGKSYYYRVGAYKSDSGVIEYTNNVFVEITGNNNSTSFNLSALNQSNGIKLTWDQYSDNIDGYKILRSTSNSTPTYPTDYYLYVSGVNNNTYIDTSAINNQEYYYRIGAYQNGSIVAYSNTLFVTANNNNDDNSDETDQNFELTATSKSNGIKLTWDEYYDNDIDGYKILRSTSDSSPTYPPYYQYLSGYDTTTYTDTAAKDSTKYYYRIGAYQNGEVIAYSNTVKITYNEDDNSDTDLSATNTNNGIKLTWGEYTDEDIDGYKLLKSTSDSTPTYPDQSYKYISGSSNESYTDTNVDDGEDYYYRLGYYHDSSIISYSNIVHITYNEDENNGDFDLSATSTSSGVKLSWDESDENEMDSYKILKSTSNSTPTYPSQSYKSISDYDTTTYTDTSVDDGEDYYYRVAIYYDGSVNGYSNIVHITYDENNDDDESDVNLSAESTDDGIELTWDEYTDEDIDGYKLLKSTSDSTPTYPSQSYRYISGSSNESYTDTYVDNGEDYYYRLGFYKDSGVVGYSNIVHVTYDEGNVSEDITLSAESTEDGIQLSWDRYNDSNIDGYKILKTASDSTPTYPDNSYKYVTGYKNNDYLDINVDDGEDYYYRIAVYQDGDAISYSDIVHITYEEN